MLLQDKVAIVHGAAGAIGSAVARVFAREGARLFLAGRSLPAVQALADELAADAAQVDALSESEIEAHADHVISRTGRIDISLNAMNPYPVQGVPLTELTVEDFSAPFQQWIGSQFLTARSAARRMIPARSGVILTLSASPARLAVAGTGGFGVACAAAEGLTRVLAAELGPQGIRVVGLRPHRIDGTLGDGADLPMPMDEFRGFLEQLTLTGHLPSLDQVAESAAFAASDRGGAMTSTMLNLTCGMDPN